MTEAVDRHLLGQALYAVATGSPTAVRCTLATAERICNPNLAKHVADSAEYSRKFGEWFAPFNTDFGVVADDVPNRILQTQQEVAFVMMDDAPDGEGADLSAIIAMRTALGYWRPLVSDIRLLATKLGRDDIVAFADKGIGVLDEADEAAVKIITEA